MHAAQKAVQDSLSKERFASAGFDAACRLLRKDRFDHVVRGDNVADKHFKIFYAGNGGEKARLGIIASKKSFPRAVDRNRVKRLVREAFRRHAIRVRKLDLVVLAKTVKIQDIGAGTEKLNTLFGRIEDRCA